MGSRPSNFIKGRRKNNHRIRMANRGLLLVTFVVFCTIFEGTMALKCYEGEFQNHPGARKELLRLKDCDRNEDLCIFIINREELTGDFSERCIESTKDLTSGTMTMCICNTDRC